MKKVITDNYGRVFNYIRMAVVEKCNLRCLYCMPEKGAQFKSIDKLLTVDEILRVVKVSASVGVSKVRFTGGEPLLRNDIMDIIKATQEINGVDAVHLTTNGILLDRYLDELMVQKISGINISLDTLDVEKFKLISRRDKLKKILENIYKAIEAGIPNIKLNMVVLRNFNSNEIIDFVGFTKDNKITVRFVELMPFDDRQIWKTGQFMSCKYILEKLTRTYPEILKSRGSKTEHHHFSLPGYKGNFAIIPAYTRSLCANCNRIRVTADGRILNCLFSNNEFNLRDIIREGCTDEELSNIIILAMKSKSMDGFQAEKEFGHKRSSMTQIGG